MSSFREVMEWIGLAFDAAGVAVIAGGALVAATRLAIGGSAARSMRVKRFRQDYGGARINAGSGPRRYAGRQFLKGIVMAKHLRWFEWRLSVAVVSAVVALSACAAQAPAAPVDMSQKIEGASNRLDHEELASQYERQALTDGAAAKRHRGYAAIYRKNTSATSGVQAHERMAAHCDNLARTYEYTAGENLAMAKLHRQWAAAL